MPHKTIPLTKGKVAIVNAEDFDQLVQYNWYFATEGYARRVEKLPNGQRKFIYMHREIMDAQRGQIVDHIDGNRLNNTRENLRFVTPSENMWNSQKHKVGSTQFKGVSKHKRGYQARIRYKGQSIHLGYFEFPRWAAQMYDVAARELFREHACLNLPDVPSPPNLVRRWTTIYEDYARRKWVLGVGE